MSYTDKHIVETYSDLFEGLSYLNKIELIDVSAHRSLNLGTNDDYNLQIDR